MRLKAVRLGLVLAALAAPVGHAQVSVDFAKITCKQLTSLRVKPDYIAVWLSGYYNAKQNNTVVDVERLKQFGKKVKTDCLYGNSGTIMETVEKLLSSQSN
jgi:hypothetical protein